ncbi:helix-turn-helix transcriptional regulator [Streptomyces sp. NPDC001822]|uniref:helix-turn-helix transcriptional regulator n=1 Tax=Streptomyces sp. NPDC001822 TaxID=3364614 RepID=UPI0036A91DC8
MPTTASVAHDPDELLTPQEASAVVKLSVYTLRDKRSQGCGPDFIKLTPGRGGRIRYRRRDIDAWLQSAQYGSAR